MKIEAGHAHPTRVMRACGYKPWVNPKTGEHSFIRRTGASYYPRFHVLIQYNQDQTVVIDLHFDARRPMHKKGIRSYEDAESPVVQQEAERIRQIVSRYQ